MLLKNGTICDYSQERKADVRIENTTIMQVEPNLTPNANEQIIDCKDKVILPALIDIAYPKNKSLCRNTLQSLSQKALQGGIGSILLRADTSPSIDSEAIIELVSSLDSALSVHFFSTILPTKSTPKNPNDTTSQKESIAEIASLASVGARAIYLPTSTITGYALHKIAQYAQMLQIPIIATANEASLADGVVAQSEISSILGLPSIPALSQTMEVARLSELARFSQTKWIFDSITHTQSLKIIENFKQMGAEILAQTPIHHLIFTHDDIGEYDTRFKLSPPLISKEERDFLRTNLNSQIDMLTCLQSDSYNSLKDQVFENASFGINAFGFYFPLGFTHLVKSGHISLSRFSEMTSHAQAQAFGLNKGAIAKGKDADIIIIDLQSHTQINDAVSPYHATTLQSKLIHTIINGDIKI